MPMQVLDAVIPTGLADEVTGLVSSVMGLFSSYPLNIFLVMGLCVGAFKVFRAAKRAAK